MKRIHSSLLLGLGAALAALAAPTLEARVPAPEGHQPPADPGLEPSSGSLHGALSLRASVDHRVLRRSGEDERYLVIEVAADPGVELPRQSVDLALVIDESGSMAGAPIEAAREAAQAIASALGPDDRLAIVGFSGTARTVLPLQDPMWAGQALEGLRAGGNTALYSGLWNGCSAVRYGAGQRQVIVLSDGAANVGPSQPWDLASAAGSCAGHGVTTSAIGLGSGFEAESLAALVDAGGGSWLYASEPSQLAEVFLQELDRSRSAAGRGVRVDLELAPGVELLDVYGYEEWDGRATEAGYSAFLGDIPAGTTRKVVARVRVDSGVAGAEELATASLSWLDPLSEDTLTARLGLPVSWSWSGSSAEESVVGWTAPHVLDARTGRALQESLALKTAGRIDEADETLAMALRSLGYVANGYGEDLGARSEVLEATRRSYDELSGDEAFEFETLSSLSAVGYVE
jgi:Ca-activated chloride channel family protein